MKPSLSDIEFHDLPISRVSLDFESNKIILKVQRYVENIGSYEDLWVEFLKVKNLIFENLSEMEKIDEIYSLDLFEIDGERKAKIQFDSSESGPSWELQFDFVDVEVSTSLR